jgi:hypothetical protein
VHEDRPDRGSYAFNQRSVIEGLAQKPDRSIIERALPVLFIRIGGNQNYWCVISLRAQCFLQFKAVLSRHLQVGDQAYRLGDHTGLEKMLCRTKSGGSVSQGLDEFSYAISGQRIIVNNRNQWWCWDHGAFKSSEKDN